jgi:hypothetical protein
MSYRREAPRTAVFASRPDARRVASSSGRLLTCTAPSAAQVQVSAPPTPLRCGDCRTAPRNDKVGTREPLQPCRHCELPRGFRGAHGNLLTEANTARLPFNAAAHPAGAQQGCGPTCIFVFWGIAMSGCACLAEATAREARRQSSLALCRDGMTGGRPMPSGRSELLAQLARHAASLRDSP